MRDKQWLAVITGLLLLLMAGARARGAGLSIDVGTHYLEPDLAGQAVLIHVQGGDEVMAVEFTMRIGDGPGGPLIEQVDILTGTIFAADNAGLYPGSYVQPWFAYQGTITASGGRVPAEGLLATLIVDTSGIFEGQFALALTGTPEGDTQFDLPVSITPGTLVIVPEPAALAALTAAGLAFLLRRQRAA